MTIDKAVATGATRAGIVAGLDVGGTKTHAVAYDERGDTVAEVRRPTAAGRDAIVPFLVAVLADLADAAGVARDGFDAAGVAVPGVVDPAAGTVRHAVNLGVGDEPLDLATPLGQAVGGPVGVANDVNLAALGAAGLLGLTGDVAYLSIGTGIALGLVLGGGLHHGATGAAGEIGHIPVDPYGPVCECGQRGCLETVASGAAIARRWPGADRDGPADADESLPPAAALLRAAAEGDERAVAVRDDVLDHLAGAVSLVAQTVDPDVVVLGGGVADAGDQLLDQVRRALERRAARSPFVAALDLAKRVVVLPPGLPVGAIGAARTALQLLREPT